MSVLAEALSATQALEGGINRQFRRLAWLGGAALSAGIALFSYRYLAKAGPVPPTAASNRHFDPWITVHAAGAATALLFGPAQFLPDMRRRWPAAHRAVGRIYVVGCLVGGSSALVLAAGISSGPIAGAGFATLGTAWLYATAQGWRAGHKRRFPDHPRWMIRSFALTFSAVTLRTYMLGVGFAGGNMMKAYPAIAWLCWVPNVVLAEAYLRGTGRLYRIGSADRTGLRAPRRSYSRLGFR